MTVHPAVRPAVSVSSRGIGGSDHGYNKLLKPAGGIAASQHINSHHPRFRFLMAPWAPRAPSVSPQPGLLYLSVAEVLVGLATDTTVYLSRQRESLQVNTLTFTIRASDSSWHPGLPGRPLFPRNQTCCICASKGSRRQAHRFSADQERFAGHTLDFTDFVAADARGIRD